MCVASFGIVHHEHRDGSDDGYWQFMAPSNIKDVVQESQYSGHQERQQRGEVNRQLDSISQRHTPNWKVMSHLMMQGSDALKAFEGLSALRQAPDGVREGKWDKENQQEDVYGGADEALALGSVRAQSRTRMNSSRKAYIGS